MSSLAGPVGSASRGLVRASYGAAAVAGTVGALVLVGWAATLPASIGLHPDRLPMGPDSAAGFVLCGLALAGFFAGRRWAVAAAAFVGGYAALALLKGEFPTPLWLHAWVSLPWWSAAGAAAAPMPRATAVLFLIVSLHVILAQVRREPVVQAHSLALGGVIVMSAAGWAVGSMAFGLVPAAPWMRDASAMGPATALGMAALAVAMVAWSFDGPLRCRSSARLITLQIAIASLACALFGWQVAIAHGQCERDAQARLAVAAGIEQIALRVAGHQHALERLAAAAGDTAAGDPVTWREAARAYLQHAPEAVAIVRTACDGGLRQIEHPVLQPYDGRLEPSDAARRAAVLARARGTAGSHVSDVLRLHSGRQGFLVARAVGRPCDARGLIVGVFRVDRLLARAPWPESVRRLLLVDARLVDATPAGVGSGFGSMAADAARGTRRLGPHTWTLVGSPLPPPAMGGSFPAAVLTAGVATAALLTGTVGLLFAALRRTAAADDARAQLTMVLAEQSAMQSVLWEATSLQQAVLENANCCIISVDAQGSIRSVNATAERWLGYEAGELVGMAPTVLHSAQELAERAAELSRISGETVEPGIDVLTHAARRGGSDERDWTYVRKDGSTLPVKLSTSPIHNESDQLTGFVCVAVDMTGERRTQAELAAARDHAIAATRAKSAFLATMTHEIRTPLGGVIGLTGLLLEDESLSPAATDTARTILRSSENLLAIVNDLLDYSKIEAGALQLERVDVDIRSLITDVFHLLGQEARRKGLALESVVAPSVPARLSGDPLRLRQIILNLVGNALKFTSTGSVSVRAACTAAEGPRRRLRIEVVDTGIGIAPEAQAQLFQSYAQADRSTSRHYGGTGLGLAICRELTELMQGTIGVDSELGRGSTFWFEVFLADAAPAAAGLDPAAGAVLASAAARCQLKVLLAEDNAINQRIAVSMLRKLGHTVTVAEDGRRALDAMAGGGFDVVLMDCQMPEMDGFEATRAIRALPGAAAATPVVALTAHAAAEDRERCLAAGMDEYLTKPLRLADLERALALVTSSRQHAPQRPAA